MGWLFRTGEAFQADAGLERDAKLGALLSIFCGGIAILLGKVFRVGMPADPHLSKMSMSDQIREVNFAPPNPCAIHTSAAGLNVLSSNGEDRSVKLQLNSHYAVGISDC